MRRIPPGLIALALFLIPGPVFRADGAPAEAGRARGPSIAGPGFLVEASRDGRQLHVRVGEREVARLTDGYLLRLRCDPEKDLWLGYDYAELNLAWLPNQLPGARVTSVDVLGIGERLWIEVTGEKPDLPGASFRTVILGEFDERGRIRYTLESELDLPGPSAALRRSGAYAEFLDVWVDRIFWPEKYRATRELYQHFVFDGPGGLLRAPKLHVFAVTNDPLASFETLNQPMPEGSSFGVVDDREGGFLFRFGRVSGESHVSVCWWTWDPHLLVQDTGVGPLSYSVGIEPLDAAEGQDLVGRARPIRFRKDPDYQLPVFTLYGVNDFRRRVGRSDEWTWERTSDGARLDPTVGYDDRTSVMAEAGPGERNAWYARALWQDPWYQVPIVGRYRVSARVRTRSTSGEARLGVVQYGGPETLLYGEPSPSYVYTEPVAGRTGWEERSVDFEASAPRMKVFLEQQGEGRAWFDNVRVVPLCDPVRDEAPRVAFHAQDGVPEPLVRFDLSAMTASLPNVLWPGGLVLAWADSWASTPAVALGPGDYRLVIHARGDGCPSDPPVLRIEGPPGLSQTVVVRPDANDDYFVPFTLDAAGEVSFRIAFVNDGLCAGGRDKNVAVRAMTLARS